MNRSHLSQSRIKHIREQGYFNLSNKEIEDISIGNRFAYILCTSLLIIGVATANIPILSVMLMVAFGGVVLPNHPFDYIYNSIIAKRIGRPKLPVRSRQLKFACTLATSFIALTIYFFISSNFLAGYITGGQLVLLASIVSITDNCIPSKVYNWFFKEKVLMS